MTAHLSYIVDALKLVVGCPETRDLLVLYSIDLDSVENVDLRVWTDKEDLKAEIVADFIAHREKNSVHTIELERASCAVDAISISPISAEVQARVLQLDTEAQDVYLKGTKASDPRGNVYATASNIDIDRFWESLRALQVFLEYHSAKIVARITLLLCSRRLIPIK